MASTRADVCSHENCGSRRFHVDDDGYTYCDRGHQQSERGTIIAEDTGELRLLGRKSRRKDSGGESTISRASSLTRPQASEQYLLCAQLVLRKQVKWLIDIQKLPAELELIARDLWALRLQSPRDKSTAGRESGIEVFSSSQVFSSKPESTGSSVSDTDSSLKPLKQGRNGRRHDGVPNLVDLLSLSYSGLLLLRVPTTVADMLKWVNSGELLYYNAARHVPLGMRERLSGDYQELLDPQDLLQPQRLHDSISETLGFFHVRFGMEPPMLNVPLLLYRWMRQLDLPIEIFAATQRLAAKLEIAFAFDFGNSGRSHSAMKYPEVRLMAVFVTAVKLLFPFDNMERHPQHETDLFTTGLRWDLWVEHRKTSDADEDPRSPLTFEEAFLSRDEDCLQYSSTRLDQYLDWYEDNIASEELREHGRAGKDTDFRRALFELFPTEKRHPIELSEANERHDDTNINSGGTQTWISIRPSVASTRASGKSVNRPGSFYRRFRTIGDVDGAALNFLEQAASLAGVSLPTMVKTIAWVETKLLRLEEHKRKASSGD